MLSPKAKRNISRILPFGLIWLFFGWVFLFVQYAEAGIFDNRPDTSIKMDYKIFIFASLAVTTLGILIGTIELLYLNNKFAKKSFLKKIIYKLFIYTSFLSIVILITFPIAKSIELNTNVFDSQVWNEYFNYLQSITHLSTIVQMGVSLSVSLFYAEISENIGHGILKNFFTGKYHSPIEEKRIFMFIDMKSSTTIAEKLGHIKYFELLKEYYVDLSDAIIEFSGEIYQYVGDEIVVSWKYENGVKNNNCICCFFAMKQDLKKREASYVKKYSLLPTFKAGFHLGEVTTGEIGALKKEIIFTGDVLNTTARIQGLCNQYEVDILISDDLLKKLDLNSKFHVQSLGKTELKGKTENLELYTVKK